MRVGAEIPTLSKEAQITVMKCMKNEEMVVLLMR